MTARLTIGIPTAGRPAAIRACLESVRQHVPMEHQVIVLDSLITDSARAEYRRQPHVRVIERREAIGPAEARGLIADGTETELLLYLDDDNLVTPGSVGSLIGHLDAHPEVGIAAGCWLEDGRLDVRALAHTLHDGRVGGRGVVLKRRVSVAEATALGLTSLRVDVTLATMLVRRAVFQQARFDARFDFYYDLFDFFMQCRQRGIRVEVLPGVVFEHHPGPYKAKTRRQTGRREDDQRRFLEKWGLEPITDPGR